MLLKQRQCIFIAHKAKDNAVWLLTKRNTVHFDCSQSKRSIISSRPCFSCNCTLEPPLPSSFCAFPIHILGSFGRKPICMMVHGGEPLTMPALRSFACIWHTDPLLLRSHYRLLGQLYPHSGLQLICYVHFISLKHLLSCSQRTTENILHGDSSLRKT